MLVSRGRLSLTMDVAAWLAVVEEIEAVAFAPVDNEIGVKAVELPREFHKDPADRIIVATARTLGAPVVTADEKIRGYPRENDLVGGATSCAASAAPPRAAQATRSPSRGS